MPSRQRRIDIATRTGDIMQIPRSGSGIVEKWDQTIVKFPAGDKHFKISNE